MRDIGLNIGNAILALIAALCLAALSLVLVVLFFSAVFTALVAHTGERNGFIVLEILLYIGGPYAVLCTLASFVIFYDKLSNPQSTLANLSHRFG